MKTNKEQDLKKAQDDNRHSSDKTWQKHQTHQTAKTVQKPGAEDKTSEKQQTLKDTKRGYNEEHQKDGSKKIGFKPSEAPSLDSKKEKGLKNDKSQPVRDENDDDEFPDMPGQGRKDAPTKTEREEPTM